MSNVTATPATIHVAPRPKPPTPLTTNIGSVWPR